MKASRGLTLALLVLCTSLACGGASAATTTSTAPASTPAVTVEDTPSVESVFDSDYTAYGFFPSPPEVTMESVLKHYGGMGQHGDFVLLQRAIPWADFVSGVEGESQARTDISNQMLIAEHNGLEAVFVVDPLNGMDRREFQGLPRSWEASFANPDVRDAFTHYTLWLVREFNPRYLGLASEINTYLDAHPGDVNNYVSLYHSVYALVKAESPETQVFVTFQWADLNNRWPDSAEGREAGVTNWDQVDLFEPNLDIWAISTFPHFIFPDGQAIPNDYYTALLEQTDKPIAIAESGYTTHSSDVLVSSPEHQVAFLEAVHEQLGGDRLAFWVYLILNDLNVESYTDLFRDEGLSEQNIDSFSLFAMMGLRAFDGTPKPALETWDGYWQEGR